MRYISILRGINVSGHKQIKMDGLKSLYVTLGFRNVVTDIQSGKIIFDAFFGLGGRIELTGSSTMLLPKVHFGFKLGLKTS